MVTIVLGGGCFWCTEAAFLLLPGVLKVTSGYAGGNTKNPTYEEVCSGATGHAEVIKVEYDPKIAKLDKIFELFFAIHDPTQLNRQGNDIGTEYRSVIFYSSEEQKIKAEKYIEKLQQTHKDRIVTEILPLVKFYPAEDWHQKYFENNPNQPYCRFIVAPKVAKAKNMLNI